uniref:Uncharacterized protein n=1 Tax=Bombyx mori TaxID=7091 RepID=A0A8R2R2A2_BOMMO|nr:uncharacterized protein LOC119629374 [Bombyx mori]
MTDLIDAHSKMTLVFNRLCTTRARPSHFRRIHATDIVCHNETRTIKALLKLVEERSKNAQITNFTHEECTDEEDCIPGTPECHLPLPPGARHAMSLQTMYTEQTKVLQMKIGTQTYHPLLVFLEKITLSKKLSVYSRHKINMPYP